MIKEIGVGVFLATGIFLAIQGLNVFPFFVLIGVGVMLYYMLENRGLESVGRDCREEKLEFSQIGGQERAKNELIEALDFIQKQARATSMGIRPLRGILLSGPPGTGKTLLAKGAASYMDSSFISVSGSEFVEMYAGVGAKRIRKLFSQVKSMAKKEGKTHGVIFIDEIDVLGSKRGQTSSHMEYDQTLNQLLVEMDGLSESDEISILVLAATNRHEALDQALLRPGRFDRVVRVELPDFKGRLHILKIHTQDKPLGDGVSLEKIARETFGFSGAHLESLANEAAILALREGEEKISQSHFLEGVDKVILGEKSEILPGQEEKKRICVHEGGHALISEILMPGSVASVTITPRGGALGYVRQKMEEERFLLTEEEIFNRIAVKLAGALAEELMLGNRSTGAGQDIKEAYRLASMYVEAGMSGLGFVEVENVPAGINYRAQREVIQKVEKKVQNLLQKHRGVLERLVETLLSREKVEGGELVKFFDCAVS